MLKRAFKICFIILELYELAERFKRKTYDL